MELLDETETELVPETGVDVSENANIAGSVVIMEEATQPPTNITHSVMTTAAERTLDFALSKSHVATRPSHPAAAAILDFI